MLPEARVYLKVIELKDDPYLGIFTRSEQNRIVAGFGAAI
jgi:hypothetical protein